MRHGGSKPAHYLQCWVRKAENEVIQGERKRPEESPGMKNGMGAEALWGMATVSGWWDGFMCMGGE